MMQVEGALLSWDGTLDGVSAPKWCLAVDHRRADFRTCISSYLLIGECSDVGQFGDPGNRQQLIQ